ncbi:MAG: helix-turn-helix transcriptional regulator [Ruminococcaceae bacterium]|nr:helix-turn-helix transcriptional regulator [Oscillospiraceae bacterium]
MEFSKTVKEIRTSSLLSQEDFAKELDVSFSTVNRWETGKTKPSYNALKKIKIFCESRNILFDAEKFINN